MESTSPNIAMTLAIPCSISPPRNRKSSNLTAPGRCQSSSRSSTHLKTDVSHTLSTVQAQGHTPGELLHDILVGFAERLQVPFLIRVGSRATPHRPPVLLVRVALSNQGITVQQAQGPSDPPDRQK